ncbi:hypothetical protein HELRODRAFT_183089 [Helobdella robusta]|uniref:Uncharacterized protein n=1 Tax=Helobdella robusta TaxID=6412 RepID=T1FJ52_HELRO|nr:hypothetical protein HELRODRAFT_183089 [Helobdella robusta]ESN89882.1 hypothetical protein HELRODRAFT_183089 [Helobdella robusta]
MAECSGSLSGTRCDKISSNRPNNILTWNTWIEKYSLPTGRERRHAERLSQVLHQTMSSRKEYFDSSCFGMSMNNRHHLIGDVRKEELSFVTADGDIEREGEQQQMEEEEEALSPLHLHLPGSPQNAARNKNNGTNLCTTGSHRTKDRRVPGQAADVRNNKFNKTNEIDNKSNNKNSNCNLPDVKSEEEERLTADQMWDNMIKTCGRSSNNTGLNMNKYAYEYDNHKDPTYNSYSSNKNNNENKLPNITLTSETKGFTPSGTTSAASTTTKMTTSTHRSPPQLAKTLTSTTATLKISTATTISTTSSLTSTTATIKKPFPFMIARKSISNMYPGTEKSTFSKNKLNSTNSLISHFTDLPTNLGSTTGARITSQTVSIKRTTLNSSSVYDFDDLTASKSKDHADNSNKLCNNKTDSNNNNSNDSCSIGNSNDSDASMNNNSATNVVNNCKLRGSVKTKAKNCLRDGGDGRGGEGARDENDGAISKYKLITTTSNKKLKKSIWTDEEEEDDDTKLFASNKLNNLTPTSSTTAAAPTTMLSTLSLTSHSSALNTSKPSLQPSKNKSLGLSSFFVLFLLN